MDTNLIMFELHDLVELEVVLMWFCDLAPKHRALQMHPLGEGLHMWSVQVHLTAWLYVEDGA